MTRGASFSFGVGAVFALAACIPSDDTPPLGSAEFVLGVTAATSGEGSDSLLTDDGYIIHFDRILLGFKTMTLGKAGEPDLCSYRGRGAVTNLIVDPRFGATQAFNGIRPVACPDVGLILGPPDGATTLGDGVGDAELVDLATPDPVQALVEATVVPPSIVSTFLHPTYKVSLRFDSRASTRFAGCGTVGADAIQPNEGAPLKGVVVSAGARDLVPVHFAAETLFLDTLGTAGLIQAQPFLSADLIGNDDGVITMAELDHLLLGAITLGTSGVAYELADGTRKGSFGDFVRAQFGFVFRFRLDSGTCVGVTPGTPLP